jgi:lipoate-protein ligase A
VHAEAEDDSERNPSPVCFQIPGAYEITVQGKKLIGSAQVRRRGGILQHGSLPLKGDITRVCQVLAFASEGQREQAVALLQTTASTAADLLGNPPTWLHAAQAIAEGFSSSLGIEFDRGDISSEEEQRAEELVASRFANQEWLARV